MSTDQLTPEVTWAQRSSTDDPEKNYIYLTINVPDVSKEQLKLDLQPTSLTFTGTSSSKKSTYHVAMEFYGEIEPEQSKINHTAANIQMVLRKKDLKADYWPRLLKDSRKMHYLKTDFDKWVDEDEQNEAGEDDYMQQFGDMGGMGGMGGEGGFGGIDFSKLGGAGGMPGMEGLDGGAEEEEDDDDDMPDLEEEEGDKTAADAADATKGKSKIEEVV